MLDYKKIQQECPKSWDLLKSWVGEKLGEFKSRILEGSKEEIPLPTITDTLVESMIKMNVRQLYDFFDVREIIISPYYTVNDNWNCMIDEVEIAAYKNRISVELAAFEEAFKQLENKL